METPFQSEFISLMLNVSIAHSRYPQWRKMSLRFWCNGKLKSPLLLPFLFALLPHLQCFSGGCGVHRVCPCLKSKQISTSWASILMFFSPCLSKDLIRAEGKKARQTGRTICRDESALKNAPRKHSTASSPSDSIPLSPWSSQIEELFLSSPSLHHPELC